MSHTATQETTGEKEQFYAFKVRALLINSHGVYGDDRDAERRLCVEKAPNAHLLI